MQSRFNLPGWYGLGSGEVAHAYLGIRMQEVEGGVAITEVRGGTPADRAGLRASTGMRLEDGEEVPTGGDVVVAFEGEEIASAAELQSAVDSHRPGDTVTLTILRGGDTREVEVRLRTRPASIS